MNRKPRLPLIVAAFCLMAAYAFACEPEASPEPGPASACYAADAR